MNTFINSADLTEFYRSRDVEHLWTLSKLLLIDYYSRFIPKSKSLLTKYPKWFTGEIIKRLRKFRSLQCRNLVKPSVHTTFRLKSIENDLT